MGGWLGTGGSRPWRGPLPSTRAADLGSLFFHGHSLGLLPAEIVQDDDKGFDSYTNLIKAAVLDTPDVVFQSNATLRVTTCYGVVLLLNIIM